MAGGVGVIGVATLLALAAPQGAKVAPGASRAPTASKPVTIPPTTVGMNLGQSEYWGPEWVFANVVANNGLLNTKGTDKIVGLKTDDGGHPIDIPKGTEIEMLLQISRTWREGVYDCTISPSDWEVWSMFSGTKTSGGDHFRMTIPKAEKGSLVKLGLRAKHDGARLDKASCLKAGLPAGTVFTPEFLDDMRGFKVIRFMDWMRTNNAPLARWENRPKPTDVSQLRAGMALEYMVEMANTLGADPWFTLPLDTDPTYYRNFATYVRDHLAPGRKAYVELSNEMWNGAFEQARTAIERGKQRYKGVDDWQAGDFYYADRVRDLMGIWSDVFAGQMNRIVRVVGGQVGWKERSDALLSHNDLYKVADAYAVAPYFGHAIQDMAEEGPARVDKVIARLPAEADKVIEDMVAQKAYIAKYGLRYISYEGGPDVIGYNPQAGADARAITHDPRIQAVYARFLEQWRTRIGDLMMPYNAVSDTTYGHKDYTGQPLSEAPKMRAVLEFRDRLTK